MTSRRTTGDELDDLSGLEDEPEADLELSLLVAGRR
jgi:hypothetical protein